MPLIHNIVAIPNSGQCLLSTILWQYQTQARASYPQYCVNTKLRSVLLNPNQASASYPQYCGNTKLRAVPLIHNIVAIPNSGQCLSSTILWQYQIQASASHPQYCVNTKLRSVLLYPNQASASYPQYCDNTKLRPVPLIHNIVTIPNSGQCLLSTIL